MTAPVGYTFTQCDIIGILALLLPVILLLETTILLIVLCLMTNVPLGRGAGCFICALGSLFTLVQAD